MGFRAAEGYATLLLWPEALEELAELPEEQRGCPAVLRLELRSCFAAGEWERGAGAARLLQHSGPFDRMMAAGFHAAFGRELLQAGRTEEARISFRNAIDTWPSCKEVVLRDPSLLSAMI